jgi:hypothetical protein
MTNSGVKSAVDRRRTKRSVAVARPATKATNATRRSCTLSRFHAYQAAFVTDQRAGVT